MSWFWFSIIALLCWSGSDFFSKIGCRDAQDKYSQFKMVMAVGVVMGVHAAYEIFVGGVEISWQVILTYLPVSLLYIGSMTLGYVGLRYIELSISSPICNASGALVAIIAILSGTAEAMAAPQYLAIFLACAGVIGLGFVEANEDEELRAARQEASNYKYAKSWERLPDLKTKSQQRNVVLHPEFVDGKYAFYTRPQDGFIDTGSGGGIGWALVEDITKAEITRRHLICGAIRNVCGHTTGSKILYQTSCYTRYCKPVGVHS